MIHYPAFLLRFLAYSITLSILAFPSLQVEEPQTEGPLFVELDLSKGEPLETLKEVLLEELADQGQLDLEEINLPETTITVDRDDFQNKLQTVHVSISLAFKDRAKSSIGYSFQQKVLIETVQTDKPQILLTSDHVTLFTDETFEPADYIAYLADDNTPYPIVRTETNLDLEKPGKYSVKYIVLDQSGNKTNTALSVEVKKTINGIHMVSMEDARINDDGSIEAMFAAINAIREANGITPFRWPDEAGLTAAAIRAEESAYFLSHTRPDGSSYHTAIEECGVDFCHWPLEVLVAYGNSVESNLSWWMSSPGHSSKLMNPEYDILALGKFNGIWCGIIY